MDIGLISDTHMPERWAQLPDKLAEIFDGVQLILHAGDVGELWVLDELAQIAPVIAVHGNDETDEATNALPYLQTLFINGYRIVLTHAHYPNRQEELASRVNDSWTPILQRRADMGKAHGADIVVFGHTHIAMDVWWDDLYLVNPGAIASGNFMQKQLVQTIARLHLPTDDKPSVSYFDVHTGEPRTMKPDLDSGFRACSRQAESLIISPELQASAKNLRALFGTEYGAIIRPLLSQLGHRVWSGQQDVFTAQDVIEVLREANVPEGVFDILRKDEVFKPLL